MKKIVIAGGGISGLAARYFLSKAHPGAEIVLYEKGSRLGGCIESVDAPYFFERGPRTFKASRCPELLDLIKELGLEGELLPSTKEAGKRYLWKDQKLQKVGALLLPAWKSLLGEWCRPPFAGDETIGAFARRRFGDYVAETFFDPITLGVFAGDSEQLSVEACFPELKAMERTHGSITRALLKREKKKKPQGLFTLQGGIETLIDRLVEKGRGPIHLNHLLEGFEGDHTILALPAEGAKRFFEGDFEALRFFEGVGSVNLVVVNVVFSKKVFPKEGFGYLVPTKEKEKILGVVFDSSIFPAQNRGEESRFTVMLREGGEIEALEALQTHLGVSALPSSVHVKEYKGAVPQYGVGHLERVKAFEAHLAKYYPQVDCIGNYLRGPSVNACVAQGARLRIKKTQ
ncbi:protoporphyrinogen oxidase [Candidatus Neptunochlamydia vexilliferae]|uniref:Coproporphyrinogen III oxidase n=1 Tax=Candidatus Neptunichlamydia vexilliferae TaxID=1651774 RepID=A0ABS0AXU6_9BACT|nr:protoporphyrinogen oxidase [Candidatus Neptunochlamydia vexilliferae]MBF5058951.1 Protoporphyrinogen oxidase [Candidatus Neptunochlamydia vexilliferae]